MRDKRFEFKTTNPPCSKCGKEMYVNSWGLVCKVHGPILKDPGSTDKL